MPLEPVQPTEVALANQYAQRIVQDVTNTAKRIIDLRTNGIPALAAQPERDLGDGRVQPARPAQAAVSAAAINAALGTANCELLDEIADALGL